MKNKNFTDTTSCIATGYWDWMQSIALALLLFVFPIPGTVALRLTLLITLCAICIAKIYAGQPRRPFLAWQFILPWLAAALFGVSYAVDSSAAWGEFKREVGYGLLAFWIGLQTLHTPLLRRAVLIGIAANWLWSLLIVSYVLYSGIGWESLPLTAKLGRTASFVSYWLTTLPLLFWLGVIPLGERQRWWAWIGLIAVASILILGSTQRIGLVVLILFVLLGSVWLQYLAHGKSFSVKTWLGLFLLICTLCSFGLYLQIKLRFHSLDAFWQQLLHDVRLDFWLSLWHEFAQAPWRGHGFGRQTLKLTLPHLVRNEDLLWHPHNLILAYQLYAGLLGVFGLLILFIGLPWAMIRRAIVAFKSQQYETATIAWSIAALVLGVLLRNQVNDMWVRDNALLFWLLLGCLLGAYWQTLQQTQDNSKNC